MKSRFHQWVVQRMSRVKWKATLINESVNAWVESDDFHQWVVQRMSRVKWKATFVNESVNEWVGSDKEQLSSMSSWTDQSIKMKSNFCWWVSQCMSRVKCNAAFINESSQWISRVKCSAVFIHEYVNDSAESNPYRVAKTHRMPYLYRSFSAEEPYN